MSEELEQEPARSIARVDDRPLNAVAIKEQVNLIQSIMKDVMIKDVHFGTIPGTDKPTLLKAGAEKLCLTFRLAVSLHVTERELGRDHREYEVRCTLTSPTGHVVGEGIGVCSTMESKFRYRWDSTGRPVPKEYWEKRDPELLGGSQFVTRKKDGNWLIFQRVEHDNPADYYNTCAKMAKKRAHVDATITGTAASDIFAQDLDDMPAASGVGQTEAVATAPQEAASAPSADERKATDRQVTFLDGLLLKHNVAVDEFLNKYGISKLELMPFASVNSAIDWIKSQGDVPQ
jgi:hypothetical protein